MEKSTKTKLIILFGLIVAVLLFVFVMYSQITVIEDVELTTSSFQDEIVIEIKEMIPDDTKCRTYARTQYEQIVDEIMTETLLGKLDKSVEDSCILVANKAIVTNMNKGDRLFQAHVIIIFCCSLIAKLIAAYLLNLSLSFLRKAVKALIGNT